MIEVLIILLLVIANGFFSASEIAIVSARRGRLEQRAKQGHKGAQVALHLSEHPDRFLATVQVGITLIGTFSAAFGGASLSRPLALWFGQFPFLAPYADALSLIAVVLFITYLSLILGELVPKQLALQSAERVASFMAPFMTLLSQVARPLVALLTTSTNLVLLVLGQRRTLEQHVTEEDIAYLIQEGKASGAVEDHEEDFIEHVFRFSDSPIRAVMTPRSEIIAINVADTTQESVVEQFASSGFSRLPLYRDSLDEIIGIVYAKDLLAKQSETPLDISTIARPPLIVSEYTPIEDLLTRFRQDGMHMAIVIDEYSQTLGLVTLEDLLEELVGEILDEYDQPEEGAFVQRNDGTWLVDAMVNHTVVRERFGLPKVEHPRYTTLAGMLLAYFKHIPQVGESITIGSVYFEVVDMDGKRIDKVLVKEAKTASAQADRIK
jgi:putative hemolysin